MCRKANEALVSKNKRTMWNAPHKDKEILNLIVLTVALDSRFRYGIFEISSLIKAISAKDMIWKLSKMNTQTVLLTGDNQQTADYFARQVGITQVRAELLPDTFSISFILDGIAIPFSVKYFSLPQNIFSVFYGGNRAGNKARCNYQIGGSTRKNGKSGYDCF